MIAVSTSSTSGELQMSRRFLGGFAAVLLSLGWQSIGRADVRLPAIIGNNMVLQAGQELPIWGWAAADEEVTVTLGEDKAMARAGADGKWTVKLPAQKTSATPVTMTVAGKNTIKVENILVGEVWAGSGQSNMEWPVAASVNAGKEIESANHPEIRLFIVPKRLSALPIDDVQGAWQVCTPQTVPPSSAVLFFFGREIRKELKVPVGLITVAWGGSRIEPWITLDQFKAQPELKAELEQYNKLNHERIAAYKNYANTLSNWIDAEEKAVAQGHTLANPPAPPNDSLAQFVSPVAMYNGMIAGIQPFALKGFLWYQGESNRGQGMHYTDMMKGLIAAWRKVWNNPKMPFLFVQLAPFRYDNKDDDYLLPEIWEAQTATLEVENTGMAVTTDITTLGDIHPPNKQDVGKRLALWAMANTYGKKDVVYSGPLYESMAVEGNAIRLKFKHTGGGLAARDGKPLSWFAIAGEDKQFHKAEATIDGNTVLVSSPAVAKPVAVRFGWNQTAEPNLSNKEGLPASPFRTDKWTDAKNAAR
jgi:sialate O-acetylesterase